MRHGILALSSVRYPPFGAVGASSMITGQSTQNGLFGVAV
jgi:hypothetical protein